MNATAQLVSAEEVIKTFFSRFKKDLFFLGNLPCTVNYVNSDFTSPEFKKEATNIFYKFARTYKEYYQIRIIDASGKEIIRINNKRDGTTVIVPDAQLQDKQHRYYFQEAMKLDKGQIYASSIDLNMEHGKVEVPYVPVIRLATPLFNLKEEKKGILIFNVSFSKVLEPLPRGTFVQTEEGNMIMLKPDGTVDFKKSRYKFNNSSGMINVSDTGAVHYSRMELFPGRKFIVGMDHRYPLLKSILQKLILISMLLFTLFLFLILIISRIDIAKFREITRAQKAIIFSLAELAEYRDPETGYHLERTRNYAVILAEQLRKNRKYRKVLNAEFIENLYDAAPLHDIGKVGIPDSILLKKGRLTREEYEEMKKHVLIGKQVLQEANRFFRTSLIDSNLASCFFLWPGTFVLFIMKSTMDKDILRG